MSNQQNDKKIKFNLICLMIDLEMLQNKMREGKGWEWNGKINEIKLSEKKKS